MKSIYVSKGALNMITAISKGLSLPDLAATPLPP